MAVNPALIDYVEGNVNPALKQAVEGGSVQQKTAEQPQDTLKPVSQIQLLLQKYGTMPIRAAEMVGGLLPTSPLTTGLGEAAIRYGETGNIPSAAKAGLRAGGADLALMLVTAGLGKIPGVKQAAKEVASTAGGFLSAIPKDAYRHVLENPNLLKGEFNPKQAYADLGKEFSAAVQKAETQAGKDVGSAKIAALKNPQNIDETKAQNIINSIDEAKQMYQAGEKISPLASTDVQRLDDIKDALTKSPKTADVANIVEGLRDDLKYGSGRTSTTQGVLKNIQRNLIDTLPEDLKNANKKYAELQDVLDTVGGQATGATTAESAIRNLQSKTLAKQEAIEKLGELSGSDITKKAKDVWSRDFFDQLLPAKGYTTGGQGGNVFRAATLGMAAHNPAAMAALSAAYSPVIHKYAIKYAGKAGKLARPVAGMAAATANPQ